MGTKLTTCSNGVSLGCKYTIVAQDDTDGYIIFDFNVPYAISAKIQVVNASNVYVDLADAVITYPEVGQVKIADGAATFTVTTGHKYSVIAQRDKS
jgi:hypothetical protein